MGIGSTVSPFGDPAQATQQLSDQSGQTADFWKQAYGGTDFNAPFRQTPNAGQYFNPAQQNNQDFLATQAHQLGQQSASPQGGIDLGGAAQRAGDNFGQQGRQAQQGMNIPNFMQNMGISNANQGNQFSIGQDINGQTDMFNRQKQLADLERIAAWYAQLNGQQSQTEAQGQQDLNSIYASLGSLGGGLAGKWLGKQFNGG